MDTPFIDLTAAGEPNQVRRERRNYRQEHPQNDESVAYPLNAFCHDLVVERWRSAARDLTRTTPQDFIASPLHCVARREASTLPAARWTLPRLRHSHITGHHRKKETVLKSHQALTRSTTRLINKLPAVWNTPNKPRASAAPPANNFLAVFVMSRSELTNARKQHTPITQTTICSKFIDRSLLRSCTPQFIDGRTI